MFGGAYGFAPDGLRYDSTKFLGGLEVALADNRIKVAVKGEWPDPMTLRRGLARADARRWNNAVEDASLRLTRGGPAFIASCAETLLGFGATAVFSPPLPTASHRQWLTAGFTHSVSLALMRSSLDEKPHTPNHLVVQQESDVLEQFLAIDQAAFSGFWQFDLHGLREAVDSTSSSDLLAIQGPDAAPVAFAIVGYGHAISYLQRLAVHPDWQGQGMGRSLVRSVLRRARAKGARAMLLNTQFENEAAINLYRDEGFSLLPDPLALLKFG